MTTHGRIDYKPRLKKWRVIIYMPRGGDVKIGDYTTRAEAAEKLRCIIDESSALVRSQW